MMTPEAAAIALEQAARDRDLLASLVRTGEVRRRRGAYEQQHKRVTDTFVGDIEDRAFPRRKINLAIRPRRRRR